MNLDRSKDNVEADEATILRFAKKHYMNNDDTTRWNGRQIYNAFKTAIALAQIENKDGKDNHTGQVLKPKLLPNHFRQIAHASRKFDEYLLETQGGETIAAMNKQHRIRDDSFGRLDEPSALKRRPTRRMSRPLNLSDLPSASEESTDISEDLSASEEESEEEERKVTRKKNKKKQTKSSSGKKDEKRGSKTKKSRKHDSEELSDESS